MTTAPSRKFKASKLQFIAHLVRESLLTLTRGIQHVPLAAAHGELGVTWIGHSSFLIQMAGKSVLIDPVFARFLILLKRRRKPGVRLRDLPPINLVLLSHAHMDHLNLPSLRGILRNNRRLHAAPPVLVVPEGVQDLVQHLGFAATYALATWSSRTIESVTVTLTPARHWGARLFNDTGRGYGGYILQGEGHTLYHAGDSAYFPGFAEIGEKFHPEIALLPIGAYSPDGFRSVHTSPEDALQAFLDLDSRTFIPMHYGTFRLSLEPMDEPPRRLLAAAGMRGIAEQMLMLEEGRTHLFAALPTGTRSSAAPA